MNELVLDGRCITCYADFITEFNRAYCGIHGGPEWSGQDFNELDDILEHAAPVTLRWTHSDVSRNSLGYHAMTEWWKASLSRTIKNFPTHEFMHEWCNQGIDESESNQGRTLFDYICWQIEQPGCKLVLE